MKTRANREDRLNWWENWFEDSPIPMTIEDWSEVRLFVERLRNSGVEDISAYVAEYPDVLAELAPACKILNANSAAVRVYNATSKQHLLEAFNAPPDLESYNPTTGLSGIYVTLVNRFSQGEISIELEGPDTTLDGSIIYIRTTTSIARGYESDWARVLQTVEDITSKKKVEDELKRNNALYRQAEVMGKLGHWTWDIAHDRMKSCSEQFASIYEMTVPEALAFFSCPDNTMDVIHPEDRSRYKHSWNLALKNRRGIDIQYRIITHSGAIRHIHMLSENVLDEQDNVIESFGTEQDITERKELSEELAYQALHDALTGLINRHEFERRLKRALDSTRVNNDEHALLYLDLDQFKVINDTYGHVAGDELLCQLGKVLAASVRKRDTLARLGGDEFGVLVEYCTLDKAREIADKVRTAIAEFRFVWEERVFRIGVSIGLVPITGASQSVLDVLSAADSACYAAKDEGRNRVHFYQPGDQDLARRQVEMHWVARIDQALEDKRLQLWSQKIVPIVATPAELEYFELLLRLVDETGELIRPEDFLPAAERYGLTMKIDRWAIGAALDWLSHDPGLLRRLGLCFINLSATSLADEGFLDFVHKRLELSQIPSNKICFEVTETAAIGRLSRAITFMKSLSSRGCRFALDDFGSGMSSFAYLKTLPVDFLKLDGDFVKGIAHDQVDLALVQSINHVGKVMGKKTIAEFVENEAILNKVRAIGVDYAQGYGIAPPVSIAESMAPTARDTAILDRNN